MGQSQPEMIGRLEILGLCRFVFVWGWGGVGGGIGL